MTSEVVKVEQQYLSLLLKHRDLVQDYFDSPLRADCFDVHHRTILLAIEDAFARDEMLTRKSFLDYVKQYIARKKEIADLERAFSRVQFSQADRNDCNLFKNQILRSFLNKASATHISNFTKNREDNGELYAITELSESLGDLADSAQTSRKKTVYEDIAKIGLKHWQHIKDVREGKVDEKEFISFGIEELDKTSGVGLAPGTMTLICGDVGGFKSTQMLNIASNVWWKGGKDVLFIPLEMPEDQIYYKWLARQTLIPFEGFVSPKMLTEKQVEALDEFVNKSVPDHPAKFFIMDSYEERSTVSSIRREIQKHLQIFKPRLVVVDYIANLQPDKPKQGRNDLEIGEMLKDLRHMGRPGVMHEEGFAIVSGAQIGREALKRVRKSAGDKTAFYSEDLRGSHEYSADADCIYAQFPDPQQPDERLQVYCVKARYGKKTFPDGARRALLEVRPEVSLIKSTADYYADDDVDEVLRKADEDTGDDLDFFGDAEGSGGEESADAIFGGESSMDDDDWFSSMDDK